MEQALLLPKASGSSFKDELEEQALQNALERLSQRKITWDEFKRKVADPLSVSRLITAQGGRTLLHLAVLDDRLDMIQALKRDSLLKLRRDGYGLSPIDLAQFLNSKEALALLQPLSEVAEFPNLPSLDSFEYLPYPIFETRAGLEEVLSSASKAKEEDKIPSEKIWMGIYFDKEIRKALHPPLSIRYINSEVGFGVFAEKKIPPCSFVGEYTGVIEQRSPKELKEKKHSLRYTIWEGKKNFAINAQNKGNFTRFMNHSSRPNLGLQSIYWRGIPRMIFISLKEIREGSQLTFDYGPLFWRHSRQSPKEWLDDF